MEADTVRPAWLYSTSAYEASAVSYFSQAFRTREWMSSPSVFVHVKKRDNEQGILIKFHTGSPQQSRPMQRKSGINSTETKYICIYISVRNDVSTSQL
jgi:hypothetical protein